MSKTLIVGTVSPTLLALKPRQVLLSHQNMKPRKDGETAKSLPGLKPHTGSAGSADEVLALEPEQRTLLHHAVALYLERNGFSKTVKKFRSEAQIEKDSSEGFLLNLEDMCYKYLKKCNQANITQNEQVNAETMKEVVDDKIPESQEQPTHKCKAKKKMKTNVVSESLVDTVEKDQPKSLHVTSEKNSEGTEPLEGNIVHEDVGRKSKEKKKKKNKQKLESVSDDLESNHIAVSTNSEDANVSNVVTLEEKVVKYKTKKKKDGEHLSDEISKQIITGSLEKISNENGGIQTLHEDECNESSKKRKRLPSVEHDSQPADDKKIEHTKRRKIEGSRECNGDLQSKKDNASVGTDVNATSRGTSNQLDEQTNGKFEKSGVKIASEKAMTKQSNGSAEPKTVNAFQRVKVDAVVFADEKLTDNSYWAKGGADSGYGAKAQEILGQVKGRGFRHEKTKKKRGTYRGGVIDLQSHSVKFNYSDED